MRARIVLDDGPPMPRRPRSVIVGNVGRLQGGVRLLSEADPADGKLDVAVLSPRSLGHWARLGWAVVRRRDRVPLMETFTAERVEIHARSIQPRQLDGDVIEPSRSLKVHIKPGALLLCVPLPEGDPDLAYDVKVAAREAEGIRKAAS
jgi:diacylglycerol kinase family enzyme